MTRALYLIDTNVFREMGVHGNVHVRAWLKTIDDDQYRISPVVYQEMRGGRERERRKLVDRGKETSQVDAQLAALDAFEMEFADREVPITMAIKRRLTNLLGAKGNNERDLTLAATALEHDLVIVTRNVGDFEGRGVRILNPFDKVPTIRKV